MILKKRNSKILDFKSFLNLFCFLTAGNINTLVDIQIIHGASGTFAMNGTFSNAQFLIIQLEGTRTFGHGHGNDGKEYSEEPGKVHFAITVRRCID